MLRGISWKTYLPAVLTLSLATCNGGGSSNGGESPLPSVQIVALDPAANERAAAVNTTVKVEFDQTMNPADSSTFVADGSLSGRLEGMYSGGGTTFLTFAPDSDFKPGEEVEITLTKGVTSPTGAALDPPFVFRFRAAVSGGDADFTKAPGSPFGVAGTPSFITTGDMDEDGDLDLAVANSSTVNVTALLNGP
ncbi:MAG: Ig-like domain-containing protein [Deltaproteobacteria bacterium]|nr:Ig-like domain-containing protein [Deltaproteobacteria bacterium]